MKKVFLLLFFFLIPAISFSQELSSQEQFTATRTGDVTIVKGRGLNYYKLVWANDAGSLPSVCSVILQTSSDRNTWTDSITGNCATNGQSSSTQIATNYIRVKLNTYTPATVPSELNVSVLGFVINPEISLNGNVTIDTSTLSTTANQTNGTQKSQICDAGGDCASVTGGILDVNATISTAGLALDATLTGGTQKTKVIDGSGNVISATSNALDVNLKSSGVTVVTSWLTAAPNVTISSGTITAVTDITNNVKVVGPAADGAAVSGSPVRIAGKDGSNNTQDLLTSTTGALVIDSAGTALPVSIAGTVTVSDGAGALNVICDSGCSGGTQYAEDTAHVSGDQLTLAGVLQQSADAAIAGDGDRTLLQVDSSGYLKVNVKAGAAAGGTSSNFGSTFPSAGTAAGFKNASGNMAGATVTTVGTTAAVDVYINNITTDAADNATVASSPVPVGCVYQSSPTALTNGQVGYVLCDTGKRQIIVGSGTAGSPGTGGIVTIQGTSGMTDVITNVHQLNGTTVDTNSGSKSAGTLRVVLATDQPALTNKLLVTPDSVALPANQSVNVSQINAVTPLMGNGASGTGAQRVTIANDSTGIIALTTGSAQIGHLEANQSSNIAQMNGVAVTMNNGAAGTGVQRVAIASDNSAIAGVGAATIGGSASTIVIVTGSSDASQNAQTDITCGTTVVYDGSTSGGTQLVAISGSKNIYVCGYEIFAAGTVNVSLTTGTGTNCASAVSGASNVTLIGATAKSLTPAWQLTTQTGKVSPYPVHGYLFSTGTANALCINTSAGIAVQAQIWYQQR